MKNLCLKLKKLNNPPSKKVDLGPRRKASLRTNPTLLFKTKILLKGKAKRHITTAKGGGFLSSTKQIKKCCEK